MLRRRRMPPEKCLTDSVARSASPVCSSAQSTCSARSATRQAVQPPERFEVLARGQAG